MSERLDPAGYGVLPVIDSHLPDMLDELVRA
jgi:hypothetical protein